jgi:hypothetical protein
MKILIACEFSGIVRDAFIAKGHDAWSCDLLPTEKEGPHIQDDVLKHLDEGWDLVISFPPCTDLSYANGKLLHTKRADGRVDRAMEFAKLLYNSGVKSVMENPRGELYKWCKPNQVIHPWMFGDPYIKWTCLWIRGLLNLKPFIANEPKNLRYWVDVGQSKNRRFQSGVNRSSVERSRTFPGIAQAMAEQWG